LSDSTVCPKVEAPKRTDGDMLWQFQRVMATLLHSDSTWADTEPFVKTLRDGTGDAINTSRQEDAYDFLTRFQEQLEAQMGGAQSKVFSKMFSVGMCQEIECKFGHAKVRCCCVSCSLSPSHPLAPQGHGAAGRAGAAGGLWAHD
jgi:hypothetical protein